MKYYLYKLSTLKVQLALMCLFALASYPLFCTVFVDYWDADEALRAAYEYGTPEYFAAEPAVQDKAATTVFVGIIGLLALIGLFITGFTILLKSFRYLRDKDHADLVMSAPVTPLTRFFGSFFAGFTVYLVPHIVCAVIGLLIIGGRKTVYGSIPVDFRTSLGRMMLYGILMCIVFYCSTALIISVCGKLGKIIKITVLMNFAVPAVAVCTMDMSFRYGYGLSNGAFDEIMTRIGWISPLTLLAEFFGRNVVGVRSYGDPAIIPVLLYSATLTAAAYFLVKHRRHERTGTAYVFRYARQVFTFITVLAVTMLIATIAIPNNSVSGYYGDAAMAVMFTEIVLWVLAAFGMFCACEFADSKGEKQRSKRFTLFFPYLVASALFTFICTFTQGFGASGYVPANEDIETVSMNLDVGSIYLYDRYLYGNSADESFDRTQLVQLHKDILSSDRNVVPEAPVYFDYVLKDGRNIHRKFYVNKELLTRAFEYEKQMGNLNFEYEIFHEQMKKSEYITVKVNGSNKTQVLIPSAELQQALWADCGAMTVDDAMKTGVDSDGTYYENGVYLDCGYPDQPENRYSGMNWLHFYYDIFPKTAELLQQYGIPEAELKR